MSERDKEITDAPKRRDRSARRKWTFRLLAILLALSPLLIGEIICRIAGYGGYPPVLKPMKAYKGERYIGTYQAGINTFFWQNLSVTGGMEEQVFVSPKPKGRTRIMAFGGSAMRGFPEPPPLVSTSFLHAMLKDAWPGRDVEVLNFGTTAIASFPVMYILDEALEYQPDLVIIYSGNNEFYGACGVASLHSFGQSTWSMKTARLFRQTGLGQWIDDVLTRPSAEAKGAKSDERAKSLMESVIADGQIGPDDSRRVAAADNLRDHLNTMVEECKARGIPVILCTLPANERDMAPLGMDIDPQLSADKLREFKAHLSEGEQSMSTSPEAALPAFKAAVELDPRHARAQYLLGKCLTALDRDVDAKPHYLKAKEYDAMPWRAPGSLSEIVRDVAKQHNVILCDLEHDFQNVSDGGVTGWELMDDHVHPTLHGQALIAESVLKQMENLPGDLRVEPAVVASLPDWEVYAKRLGANKYDRFGVEHRMLTLFKAPFYAKSNPEALARGERRCAEFRKSFTRGELKAIEYWEKPEAHASGFRPITGFVGAELLSEGKYAEADAALSVARRSVAEYSLWNLELTWKALTARRHIHARPTPDDLAMAHEMIEDGETMYRATGIRSAELCRHLGLAYHLVGDFKHAIPDLNTALKAVNNMSGFDVVDALVDSLVRTGRRDLAIRVLKSPIKDPKLAEGCQVLLQRVMTMPP